MNIKTNSEFWNTDVATYNQLQKLKKFVDFVAGLEFSSTENKKKAIEINCLIANINKPEFLKGWCVCLDIYDRNIQNGISNASGIYHRKWNVFFENYSLEIEAETSHSEHTMGHLGHYGDGFHYFACIYFNKEVPCQRISMDTDLNEFVEDAINYKSYITETLNDIEIEIDVW